MEAKHAPQRFGRYVLLDRMGAGGMAEVFRAVVQGAEGFRRDLVVKRILSDRASAPNFIEMFVHEARISALLHHPNVVQVFDFGQVDGSYFLAMELLRGSDLLAMFRSLRERQRMFPIPIAAHVAHQVALGLGYAHALTSADDQPLNIIHRDVSPANIMCLRTGGVKLLDFGIAQAIGEMDSEESEPGSFKGKLGYMAPERLRDEAQDGRVDLFSLGAVLWEMLAGRRLFHGKTEVDKLHRLLDNPIPPPSSFRPDIPAELDRIVLKALARDPNERYATGQAMADDLEVVVGETKYQSRMLPALLRDLFGSAPSAAHITLSMASPEMLAFDPPAPSLPALSPSEPSPSPKEDLSRTEVSRDLPRVIRRLRDLRMATKIAIVTGTLASIVVIALGFAPKRIPDVPSSRAVAPAGVTLASTAVFHEAGPVPSPPPAPSTSQELVPKSGTEVASPVRSAPAVSVGVDRTAFARRPARPLRPGVAKAGGPSGAGRITRGLSIDPFAEAATRGPRR